MGTRKHRRSLKRYSRSQKGGDLGSNPPSAWGWTMGTVGNGWTQFMDSLTLQSGQNAATSNSNNLVPVSGAYNQQPTQNINMKGGRHKSRKNRKGGSMASVLNRAAVPFILLGAQQMYKKRKTKK